MTSLAQFLQRSCLLGVMALHVTAHAQSSISQPKTDNWNAPKAERIMEAPEPLTSSTGTLRLRMPQGPGNSAGDPPQSRPTPVPEPHTANPPAKPSQFQRFVEESTGRWLPLHGAELFERSEKYTADAQTPPAADYRVATGDEIRLQIWGAVDYVGSHTVDRQGQISLPRIGVVTVAGTAVKDLEAVIRKSVSAVFNNVQINASLGSLRGLTVYVVGQARQPGTHTVSPWGTLVNALFASGGPDASGSMRQIQLKRGGKLMTTLDLYDFIVKGDKANDVPLQSGDVIVIPPAGPRVAVTGAWDHAAIYELLPGHTLQDILSIGGGVPRLVNPQKALLERIDAARSPARSVQEINLQGASLRTPLQDGDVVTLLSISPAFENAVTLQGAVAQPLRHAWVQGMRIRDLIPDREALITPDYYKRQNQLVQKLPLKPGVDLAPGEETGTNTRDKNLPWMSETSGKTRQDAPVEERLRSMADAINWDYAVIERLHKDQVRTELIPFHLGKAILQQDPAQNIQLLPGDVVTIMSSRDLRLPVERQNRLVRVEGEVAAPGVYQAKPGETLPQLIARIGGLTAQAYVYGTEFTRESVRKQQQTSLDALVRRLEAQLSSSANASVANLTGDRAAQSAALQQAQQQQMKAQLERIKTMKSVGRVSLELPPVVARGAVLPDLLLEDGDAVMIPPQPAFVSAAGSVNNENVLLFKSGKTVGDVIRTAGLTEEAEPNEIFVLRADGSILGRRSSGFLRNFDNTELMPGDTVVVPAMLDRESRYNFVIRAFKDWTQILSNFGLGVASLRVIRSGL